MPDRHTDTPTHSEARASRLPLSLTRKPKETPARCLHAISKSESKINLGEGRQGPGVARPLTSLQRCLSRMTPKFRAIRNLTRGWQRWPPAKRSGSGREVTESSSLLCKRPRAPRCQILPPTQTGRPRRPENRAKQTHTAQGFGEQGVPCSCAPVWVFCGDFLKKSTHCWQKWPAPVLERGQGEPPTTSGVGQAALRTPASAVKGRSAEKSEKM